MQDLTIVAKHTISSAIAGSRAPGPGSNSDRRDVLQVPVAASWSENQPRTPAPAPRPERSAWQLAARQPDRRGNPSDRRRADRPHPSETVDEILNRAEPLDA
ncbi:hypothetical protein ACQP00_36410 [Dactylosporangium sp. CS-047395]|uniref:hypothetical protein n=1 Tax=Dactylosporangium sp. CS-047395 TaxID=3239936 RepID=UPI003D922F8F